MKIRIYDNTGEDSGREISTCGYSPISIFVALVLGLVMILALVVNGFRKLDPGMPVASSCSAAISAACHLPLGEEDAALYPLMYGVVEKYDWGDDTEYTGNSIAEDEEEVGHGHPCFSSEEVSPLLAGHTYV